jgi:hypothetical protein
VYRKPVADGRVFLEEEKEAIAAQSAGPYAGERFGGIWW